MSDEKDDDDKDTKKPREDGVGYGRPPREHRFPLGKSGNPGGRKKGARGFKQEKKEVLQQPIAVAGSKRTVTSRKATVMRLQHSALKGNVRAAVAIIGMADALDAEDEARTASLKSQDLEEEDKALIAAALARLSPAR